MLLRTARGIALHPSTVEVAVGSLSLVGVTCLLLSSTYVPTTEAFFLPLIKQCPGMARFSISGDRR